MAPAGGRVGAAGNSGARVLAARYFSLLHTELAEVVATWWPSMSSSQRSLLTVRDERDIVVCRSAKALLAV